MCIYINELQVITITWAQLIYQVCPKAKGPSKGQGHTYVSGISKVPTNSYM